MNKNHLPLSTNERHQLFKITASTPRRVEQLLTTVPAEKLTAKPGTGFALLEHAWHLAELEQQGFNYRLRTLLTQDRPALPQFDGDAMAVENNYLRRSLRLALIQFSQARLENLWLLSGIDHASWMRRGMLEAVGEVSVVTVFRAMAEHDTSHLQEINSLISNEPVNSLTTTAAA